MPKWKRTCKDDMVTWFGFYNGLELTEGFRLPQLDMQNAQLVLLSTKWYMSHVGQCKSHKEGRLDVMG